MSSLNDTELEEIKNLYNSFKDELKTNIRNGREISKVPCYLIKKKWDTDFNDNLKNNKPVKKFYRKYSMTERIEASPEKFIQSFFRMRWGNTPDNWHTARVTQIPTYSEKAYILTIQSVHGNIKRWLDELVAKYPELL